MLLRLVAVIFWLKSISRVDYYSHVGFKGYTYLYVWYVGTLLVFLSGMLTRFMVHFTAIDGGTIGILQYSHEILSGLTLTVGWYMYLCFFVLFNFDLPYWIVNTILISILGYDLYCYVAHPDRTIDLIEKNANVLFFGHFIIISWCTGNPLLGLIGAFVPMMAMIVSGIGVVIIVPFWHADQVNEITMMFMASASYIFTFEIYATIRNNR